MKFTGRIREPEKLTASFPALKLPLSGGYEEGYADGRTDGYTEGEQAARAEAEAHNAAILTDCNAVLPDKGVEPADTLEQVPQRIEEIQSYSDGYDVGLEDGKQAEYDRFWDAFQQNGNRTNYDYAFGNDWTDDIFKPKYPITLSGNVYNIFDNSSITYIDESLVDCSKATLFQYFLSNNRSGKPVTAIMDIASCTRMVNSFIYSDNLETVELKNIREDCEFQNTFLGCSDIVNFRCSGIIGKNLSINSPDLSNESVQNIIDHLKDLSGATAQTLTFHRDVYDRLTEEQKATVAAKNWTLVRA